MDLGIDGLIRVSAHELLMRLPSIVHFLVQQQSFLLQMERKSQETLLVKKFTTLSEQNSLG
jgi:hypothetical protein